jgi:hypothetical protein
MHVVLLDSVPMSDAGYTIIPHVRGEFHPLNRVFPHDLHGWCEQTHFVDILVDLSSRVLDHEEELASDLPFAGRTIDVDDVSDLDFFQSSFGVD